MSLTDKYISHIKTVRRYSPRTVEIYSDILKRFTTFTFKDIEPGDGEFLEVLTVNMIRAYEVYLLDKCGESARTVGQHLSVLSGLCNYLLREGIIEGNPVRQVKRPKVPGRLPEFFRSQTMEEYLEETAPHASEENLELIRGNDELSLQVYTRRLDRLIVRLLYDTGMRRAELISLRPSSFDFSRNVVTIRGKGDKMREIPLVASLCQEIFLYLKSTALLFGSVPEKDGALLLTSRGTPIYPMYVERAVTREMGREVTAGRRSPHMLRHTIATQLLDNGAGLSSIKEMLGHSSLAATQVYTHNSIAKLKNVYNNAHPRAKRGGNNGDQD